MGDKIIPQFGIRDTLSKQLTTCWRIRHRLYIRVIGLWTTLSWTSSQHWEHIVSLTTSQWHCKDNASKTRSNFHCAHWHSFFPLRKAPPLISVFFNSLYDPFGSPCRGQKRCSNRCAIRMADHQKSALVFCAGWNRLAVLLGPLPSGEETILQKGLCTLL